MSNTIRIAITSFLIDDSSWAGAAAQQPDHSRERYKRLVRLSNAILKVHPRPHYVVFPELAIPRRWARALAHHFVRRRISVIMGVEYTRTSARSRRVINEARLYLTDSRLGYPTWCVIKQRKGYPAHHERSELRSRFGVEFPRSVGDECTKRVYRHYGFTFALLICSELTDLTHRQRLRGRIDNLFVLSWNQDLESFASLVETSALDIHCFMTFVNNRAHGDSRVRAPYKDTWRRDVVRVKGGVDDYFVVTELDIDSLREFQSHVEPPGSPFKPFPEGFVIDPGRKVVPESRQ